MGIRKTTTRLVTEGDVVIVDMGEAGKEDKAVKTVKTKRYRLGTPVFTLVFTDGTSIRTKGHDSALLIYSEREEMEKVREEAIAASWNLDCTETG